MTNAVPLLKKKYTIKRVFLERMLKNELIA
jgi:hypothetical protein